MRQIRIFGSDVVGANGIYPANKIVQVKDDEALAITHAGLGEYAQGLDAKISEPKEVFEEHAQAVVLDETVMKNPEDAQKIIGVPRVPKGGVLISAKEQIRKLLGK